MRYTDNYLEDLKRIEQSIPNIEQLHGKSILITGASGLIGSAVTDFLALNIKDVDLYLASRDEKAIKKRFPYQNYQFVQFDALEEWKSNTCFDYIIHTASPANPCLYAKMPVETMLANLLGTKNILEHVRQQGRGSVLFVSSSEVYGKKENAEPYKEQDYLFVDILNPRSCYPSAKRAAETMIAAYHQEFQVDGVIARPGHVYGPTAKRGDTRASSQFFYDALEQKKIVMKSEGKQIRSYCYVLDCVSALLTIMLNGEAANAYNISNELSVCSIRELAECIAREASVPIEFELPTERETASYNMMDNSSLDAKRLYELGWKGLFDLEMGVKRTLEGIES